MTKRRRFTPEFKAQVVLEVLTGRQSPAEACRTHALSPNLLVEASLNYDGNIIDIVNSPSGELPAGYQVNKFFDNGSTSAPSFGWTSKWRW